MVIATTPLRRAEDLRVDDRGRDVGAAFGFDPETFAPTYRLNLRHRRAAAWRSRSPARLGLPAVDHRRGAREPERARSAAGRAPGEDRPRHAGARARAPARGARARDARGDGERKLQRARGGAARARGDVPAAARTSELDEQVREARREIDAVIDALKAKTDALAADAERRGAAAGPDRRHRRGAQPTRARRSRRSASGCGRRRTPAAGGGRRSPNRDAAGGRRPRHRRRPRPRRRSSSRCTTARPRSTSAASGMRASVDDLRVIVAAARRRSPARVSVNVELQPREAIAVGAERDRLHVDEALSRAGTVPRRVAAQRAADACG